MIEYLNNYSNIITLFFTGVVGISTLVYAILTAKLVKETMLLRKAQTNPGISVSLVQNKSSILFIDLLVENIGMGPAYDVKFDIIRDFELNKRLLSEVGFMKNGINYFAPNQAMQLWVATFVGNKELENKSIDIKVTFKNYSKDTFARTFNLSFSQFANFIQLGTPPLIKIADNIEKIERYVDNIVSGFKKIKVDIYDTNDRKIENKLINDEFKKFNESQKKNK